MHSRQQSVPVQPTYAREQEMYAQQQQQQQQQQLAQASSFWTRHNVFTSIVRDIFLWERVGVSVGTYAALIWLFFIIRAMIPDETSSTLIVIIFAFIATAFILAGQNLVELFQGSFLQDTLLALPQLLIAAPRDEESKQRRAVEVENAFSDISYRVDVFLVELNLAVSEGGGQPSRLTVMGKCILGSVFILLAFMLSMFETRTLVCSFLAVFILLPPIIRYDVVARVVNALSAANNDVNAPPPPPPRVQQNNFNN